MIHTFVYLFDKFKVSFAYRDNCNCLMFAAYLQIICFVLCDYNKYAILVILLQSRVVR